MSEAETRETAEFKHLSVMRPETPAPPGMIVRVDAAGQSHTGLVRLTNEDHFLCARLSRTMEVLHSNLPPADAPTSAQIDGYILAVADGVGGHAAGERASSMVIARGIEFILSSANWALKLDPGESARLVERMREYFDRLNESLREAVEADEALAGMATTLTVVYTVGLRAFIVHVGDSRVYVFRDGSLTQLTRDHTVAQELADEGQISPEAIRNHPRRNVLTNVIASGRGFHRADIGSHELKDGDTVLLCTDGLSDLLDSPAIKSVIAKNPRPRDLCPALIDAALAAGGKDNVTCVAARYEVGAR
jgi:serine/threonine protein phosphatase PrpC